LFTANSTIANHYGQSLCLYSVKNLKYCSNSWFIYSVCPSVYEWNTINNLVSNPSILFNSLVNSITNCGSLLEIILFSKLYNFYMLFLNNLAKPSADILFVVATKCLIFDNLSHTTRITSFPATNSYLIIKFTIRCIYGFFGILLNFNFPTYTSVLFFIL